MAGRETLDERALAGVLNAAVQLAASGRLDEAARALESAGRPLLSHPVAQNVLGSIRLDQGRARDALKAFDRALKTAPRFPEAHCNRGVALQALGRERDALAACETALRLRPGYAKAHFNRGNVLKALGRTEEAVAAYGAALKAEPGFAEAHLNRGSARLDLGSPLEALADFNQALARRAGYLDAQIGRASALRALGRFEEAASAVAAILAAHPGQADALLVRCQILLATEQFTEALVAVEAHLESRPESAEGEAARALVLWRLKRVEAALDAASTAMRIAPDNLNAITTRAVVLGELGRFAEQQVMLDKAAKLGADDAQFHRARAIAHYARGDSAGALAAYDAALARDPGDAVLRYDASHVALSMGDFARGWRDHEARLKTLEFLPRAFTQVAPAWQGEDIAGKKLLVFCEQGLGDTLQFVRYLPLVRESGAEITFILAPALANLLRPTLEGIAIADRLGLRAGFAHQSGLMSLPHVFATRLETIPASVPYVFADPALVDKWRGRLGGDGFKIGIVWQGNPAFRGDRLRSAPLAHYAPLARIPGVRLISLQAVHGLDQLDALPAGMTVEQLGPEITDNSDGLTEIAAVMANLDLIVCSDTAAAHLAGALGRPTWVALSFRPDWRWLEGRADSPWYPTMRLFRQPAHGDWGAVFAEMAAALRERVAAG